MVDIQELIDYWDEVRNATSYLSSILYQRKVLETIDALEELKKLKGEE